MLRKYETRQVELTVSRKSPCSPHTEGVGRLLVPVPTNMVLSVDDREYDVTVLTGNTLADIVTVPAWLPAIGVLPTVPVALIVELALVLAEEPVVPSAGSAKLSSEET